MNILTETQQLDALWAMLRSSKYWISVDIPGEVGSDRAEALALYTNTTNGSNGERIKTFSGPTREDAIGQLIAFQVAERLE